MRVRQVWRLLKETVQEWNEDKASQLAASLAYYTVFSLAPLLVIVIAIASLLFDRATVQDQLTAQMQGLVGQEGASLVQTALENANQPGQNSGILASVISIGLLILGASGVFGHLQDALNTIWNVKAKPENAAKGFVQKRLLSFAMVVTIGFLLMVSLVVTTALAAVSSYFSHLLPGSDAVWRLLNIALSLAILSLLFALLYKYVPDVKIHWGDVWFGAIVTAVLFTIGKYVLGMYVGNGGFGSVYGAAGSVIVVLAWVYYSAQILFFGAELTQVYARRYGSQITPDEHAVPLDPKPRTEQDISRRRSR